MSKESDNGISSKVYYRGDTVFLYTKFRDENNNIINPINPRVRILHDNDGDLYEDLPWTVLNENDNEYFNNFVIPFNADLCQYQIIYCGDINNEPQYSFETFHVISKSDKYEDTTKLFGYVYDSKDNSYLLDVNINIYNMETNEKVSQTLSNHEGYWEAYVYPGLYTFKFNKIEFSEFAINAEIGDEHNEIQFNNIGLDNLNDISTGNGIYKVTDTYVTKKGTPLNNLNINIYSILEMSKLVASDITDDNGVWNCYLNPGIYVIKINGLALGKDFDRTIRLKVDESGQYAFEDVTNNNVNVKNSYSNGIGSKKIFDYVKDKYGNPLVDIQVNAFKKGDNLIDQNIIAQDYTDVSGKWNLNLDPGEYVIEYYHPNFKSIAEERNI